MLEGSLVVSQACVFSFLWSSASKWSEKQMNRALDECDNDIFAVFFFNTQHKQTFFIGKPIIWLLKNCDQYL